MPVRGVGIDLVEINRMENILNKDDSFHFRNRVFSESEIRYCEKSARSAQHYWVRFAAKEAFIKAFGRNDLALREIVVERRENGAPYLTFSDQLLDRIPQIRTFSFHLSLSHSRTTATAVVVIES